MKMFARTHSATIPDANVVKYENINRREVESDDVLKGRYMNERVIK